jgi:hypothetical protein
MTIVNYMPFNKNKLATVDGLKDVTGVVEYAKAFYE